MYFCRPEGILHIEVLRLYWLIFCRLTIEELDTLCGVLNVQTGMMCRRSLTCECDLIAILWCPLYLALTCHEEESIGWASACHNSLETCSEFRCLLCDIIRSRWIKVSVTHHLVQVLISASADNDYIPGKLHSESSKRAVAGRRRPFEVLLQEFKANKLAAAYAGKPHDTGR